ncbi:tetratricopeptide repeat protein [Planctomycetales bacterium ZRK34]|nr:tetratricopeptide repeat protein [Planctomycetales bacterium ZRK34]
MKQQMKYTLWMMMIAAAMGLTAGCTMAPKSSSAKTREATELAEQASAVMEMGNLELAMELFQEALAKDHENVDAHIGIGDLHQMTGNYVEAAREYKAARDLKPNSYDANFKLGLAYHLLNRLRDAIRTYLTALTINPSSMEANLNLATAYLQIGEPRLALPYAQRAVELDPDHQPARVNLGAIYAALGQHDKALAQYRTVEANAGELDEHVAVNLATAELKSGSPQKAVELLTKLIKTNPTATYYERLGYAQYKLENLDASQEAYEQALKLDDENTAALNGLGVNLMTRYIQSDRTDLKLRNRAVTAWQKSVRLNLDQPKILDLISRYSRL